MECTVAYGILNKSMHKSFLTRCLLMLLDIVR